MRDMSTLAAAGIRAGAADAAGGFTPLHVRADVALAVSPRERAFVRGYVAGFEDASERLYLLAR